MKANSLKMARGTSRRKGKPKFPARVRVTILRGNRFLRVRSVGRVSVYHNNSLLIQGVTESVLVDNVNKCIANNLRFR